MKNVAANKKSKKVGYPGVEPGDEFPEARLAPAEPIASRF
jgi:hypothetical protein